MNLFFEFVKFIKIKTLRLSTLQSRLKESYFTLGEWSSMRKSQPTARSVTSEPLTILKLSTFLLYKFDKISNH